VDNHEHPRVCVDKKNLRSRQGAALFGLKEEKRTRLRHAARRKRGTASLRCAVSFLFDE